MKRSALFSALLAVVLVTAGCMHSSPTPTPAQVTPKKETTMEKKPAVKEEEKVMDEKDDTIEEEKVMDDKKEVEKTPEEKEVTKEDSKDSVATKGAYLPYSENLVASASGDVVLFFHASWCPSCRGADADITAKGLPAGVTVLKVDYDNSAELKKKYGVTSQHTFVQVDNKGNKVQLWNGGDRDSIVAKVQ